MIVLVLFGVLTVVSGQSVQVLTEEGVVEGYEAVEGGYYAFQGIPYARPRVGSDMFRVSGPPSVREGIFYANRSGVECAHPSRDGMLGVLDCLVLNIFTSDLTASKPVLVWLNGEESTPNVSSQYSYKRLINEQLLVVTLNYRLSVFGFLCLRSLHYPGNVGLRDIILGLEWIHKNIARFGGDPSNVVLVGHGFAAAMADIITLTANPSLVIPDHRNYLHKAITLSGSVVAPWAMSYDPVGAVLTLNRDIGGPFYYYQEIPHMLASRSLDEINDALNRFKYTNNTPMFAPCIENTNMADFLITGAFNTYQVSKDMPYMAGYVTNEGTQRVTEAVFDGWLEKMRSNFRDFLPVDLDFGSRIERRRQAKNIRNFYFDNQYSFDNFFDYYSDSMVVAAMIRSMRMRAQTSRYSDVYLLEFGYVGTNNSDWNFDDVPLNKVRHGSFLNYIFDFDLNSFDEVVANSFVKRLAAFAYTGNPTPANSTDFPYWLPFKNESTYYLSYYGSSENRNFEQKVGMNPQNRTMAFWDPLYNMYLSPPSSAGVPSGLLSVVILGLFVSAMV